MDRAFKLIYRGEERVNKVRAGISGGKYDMWYLIEGDISWLIIDS